MEERGASSIWSFLTVALILSVTVACSSDDDGGGSIGGVGDTMADVGALGDEFVGENEAAYDGVAYTAESLAATFGAGNGITTALFSAKQNGASGCIPEELAGITHAIEPSTGTFSSTEIEGAPPDAARFYVYELSGGMPTETVIGSVDVTCQGTFPSQVTVRIAVTVNAVTLLDLTASNASFSSSGYFAQLSGFLSNAEGTDQINFGNCGFEGGSSISEDFLFGGGPSSTVNFDLGDGFCGLVRGSRFESPEDGVFVRVSQTYDPSGFFDGACPSVQFEADLRDAGSGVSGPGTFCAPPPTADGFLYHVACFEGTRARVDASVAEESCLTERYILDPTPLGSGLLAQIEQGTNAMLGMARAVNGVAQVGAELGTAFAIELEQQL